MSNTRSRKKAKSNSGNEDPKGASTALESRFAQAQSLLNPRRRQLIRAILNSPDETCFLSSRELAKRFNVDAATIVRTTQVLGYESFAAFAADLRQHFVTRINPYTVLKAATKEKRSLADHIDHSLDKALDNINTLRASLDSKLVIELARRIHRARRILIIGVDFAASLSYYFAYGLSSMGFDAEAPIGSTGYLQYKVEALTAKDLLVGISFGQCLRETVEAVLRAKKQGVPTFGITDSDTTPIARYCNAHLVALVAGTSFFNSYVTPIAAIDTILVACAHVDPKRSLTRLRPTDKEYVSGRRWYREPKGFNGEMP
ncbi:MAG TPA: MurR/RpiR family transcriptional regulator [Blastocatellia bacterium]|nr:MurR/RpiR family transcriptional regulator [Blastocatellia bacterium]